MLISFEGTGKNQLEPGQVKCSSVVTLFFAKKSLAKNERCAAALIMEEKPNVGSPFCGTFPSDRIPKVTKDLHVHFLIHSTSSCKLNQRIPGTF